MGKQTTEMWLHKKISPVRDDKLAIAYAAEDLAREGYCIDRLHQVDATEHRSHWRYELPIKRVVN